jgi:hypothetical protein
MSGLLDLASEPFAELVSFLGTRGWLGLWLCGDVRLQWKLGRGKGVREMVIGSSETSNGLWPSQINHLDGLMSFCIIRSTSSPYLGPTSLELSNLSQNLKKLVLESKSSLEAFQALESLNQPHFVHLETLHLKYESTMKRIEFKIPRTVTDLKIRAFYYDSSDKVLSLPLSSLPPNLVKLDCAIRSFEVCGDDERFPSTLQILEVLLHSKYAKIDEDGTSVNDGSEQMSSKRIGWTSIPALLPPSIVQLIISLPADCWDVAKLSVCNWKSISNLTSLEKLTLPMSPNVFFTAEAAMLVPRSVERLNLSGMDFSGWETQSIIEILNALPPKIRLLESMTWPLDFTLELTCNLPRHLERLENAFIPPSLVSYVPQSLRELQIEFGDYSLISHLPPNLQCLTIYGGIEWLVDKLPPHLDTLILDYEQVKLSEEIVSQFPRNLINLYVAGDNPYTGNVELVFKALPRTLRDLGTYPVTSDADSLCPVPAPLHSSQFLPRDIHALAVGCLDFYESNMIEWIVGLPKKLVSLKLNLKQLQKGALATIGSSLSSLTILTISVLESPSSSSSSGEERGDSWSQHIQLGSLPLNLLEIDITDMEKRCEDSGITNENFVGAPPGLRWIALPASPLVTKDCLSHLPDDLWSRGFITLGDVAPAWLKERQS